MTNNRIYWAIEAAGLAPLGSESYTEIHGLQTCGINVNFTLNQIYELGQLEIYENVEEIPDVEVTLEKVLDGYPLIYHLATRGYSANTLSGRQNQRCNFAMSVFGDTQSAASGQPVNQVDCSGMYVSRIGYTFSVNDVSKEEVTLVGNNKVTKTSSFTFTGSIFDNEDSPLALALSGGVQQRQDIIYATNEVSLDANNQVAATDATILPPDIDGITSSGTNPVDGDGVYGAHVQSISTSIDLGREALTELGSKLPYFRYATFPTDVTTDIEVIATQMDTVDVSEAADDNLTHRSIRIYTREGTAIDLGLKNKLQSVSYGGADAGGGNATITYSYLTQNAFDVTHPQDPVV